MFLHPVKLFELVSFQGIVQYSCWLATLFSGLQHHGLTSRRLCTGVARGCGWQDMGAWVNLGAFYIVGLPTATVLAYYFHFNGRVGVLTDACVVIVYRTGIFLTAGLFVIYDMFLRRNCLSPNR